MIQHLRFKGFLTTIVFFIFSATLLAQSAPLANRQAALDAGFDPDRLERLDNYFAAKVQEGELPGGVCMVYRKGVLAHEMTFGPSKADDIFYIQSMTKPIISVALMTLYEEGHFELNDPIAKYIPEFAAPQVAVMENGEPKLVKAERPITIAQCFSHTAGLLHGLSEAPLDRKYAKTLYGMTSMDPNEIFHDPHQTIRDRVVAMSALPLAAQPDQVWMYSASPDILALLIEHFSGMPVDEFLQKHIFDPLGMNDSGYNLSEEQAARMATLHLQNEEKKQFRHKQQTPTSGNTVFGGTHGLFSTVQDYLKFSRMLLNQGELNGQRILGRKTIELMTTNHAKHRFRGPGAGFGLGFGVRTDLADGKALGSEGQFYWGGMFNTYFFVDPEEELTAVLMMQFFPYTEYYNLKFRKFVYQAIVD